MKKLLYIAIISFFCIKGLSQGVTTDTTNYLASDDWDEYSTWILASNTGSIATTSNYSGLHGNGVAVAYSFPDQGDWFNMDIALPYNFNNENSIAFFIKSSTPTNNLELKFIDTDGSIFWRVIPMSEYTDWTHVVIYKGDTEYAWGGNSTFDQFSKFAIAGNGIGSGTVWIDEIGVGLDTLRSTFPSIYDPDSILTGIGFKQRRDSAMHPEDTLIIKYLKVMQDISSTAQALLPSQEDEQAQTFNNSLVAIAFIVKDEKERAERILDFYANATDMNNTDILKQNFYYKVNGVSQARGFFQECNINTLQASGTKHRWMGDMAWLLIACKHYELKYGAGRYDNLIKIIKDLLFSYYQDASVGGYVRTGWRDGDSYFDTGGHHEGNIDCYVVFKLCGDNYRAQKIKMWIEDQLKNMSSLPLDLYTWRPLAFGKNYAYLMDIPEFNYNYRKVIKIKGKYVMGFYSFASAIDNFWNDGTGHISCAYQAFGDTARGYFYANQMDQLIIERIFGNDTTHAISYTLNKTGGYEWVDTDKGFTSCAAWYIMAKNGINPFMSANFTDTVLSSVQTHFAPLLLRAYPNPFTNSITISYSVTSKMDVNLSIFDNRGAEVKALINSNHLQGNYSVTWNGNDNTGHKVADGIYFVKATIGNYTDNQRILYINK